MEVIHVGIERTATGNTSFGLGRFAPVADNKSPGSDILLARINGRAVSALAIASTHN